MQLDYSTPNNLGPLQSGARLGPLQNALCNKIYRPHNLYVSIYLHAVSLEKSETDIHVAKLQIRSKVGLRVLGSGLP